MLPLGSCYVPRRPLSSRSPADGHLVGIEQLRRYCPELGGRVGGAADLETGVESVIAITDPVTGKFVYPAAVVIPLEDEAGSNDLLDGNLQTVTETVGIIVEFDASADRRGQAGVSPVEAMKYARYSARC